MTDNHTPEPWRYQACEKEYGYRWQGANIGSEHDGGTELVYGDGPDLRRVEDARRIVACVNACKGLPTEELERYGIGCLDFLPYTPTKSDPG